MTATLVAKNLAGGFAHRTLFEGLDLTVAPGDVVGVVGVNGAGKSTLLRILAGDVEPLDGTVNLAPADAFVGWLPQEHQRVTGETVAGYIARRTGCTAATQAMEAAAAVLADPGTAATGDDAADASSAALDHWLASGAADLDERLPAVLADLGLDSAAIRPESTPMTALSGGQAARVAIRPPGREGLPTLASLAYMASHIVRPASNGAV
jgi:ATPase subunit of ABC transporter with duplicated ATPase domains